MNRLLFFTFIKSIPAPKYLHISDSNNSLLRIGKVRSSLQIKPGQKRALLDNCLIKWFNWRQKRQLALRDYEKLTNVKSEFHVQSGSRKVVVCAVSSSLSFWKTSFSWLLQFSIFPRYIPRKNYSLWRRPSPEMENCSDKMTSMFQIDLKLLDDHRSLMKFLWTNDGESISVPQPLSAHINQIFWSNRFFQPCESACDRRFHRRAEDPPENNDTEVMLGIPFTTLISAQVHSLDDWEAFLLKRHWLLGQSPWISRMEISPNATFLKTSSQTNHMDDWPANFWILSQAPLRRCERIGRWFLTI
jgi:hypothetical protein